MPTAIQQWLRRLRCDHDFKYSRSRPGTLVCKKCMARRGRPAD